MVNFAQYIEHTLLKPEATKKDITKLCAEAKQYEFLGVCVNPYYVPLAKKLLAGSAVKVVTVVGFPLGATYSEVKVLETRLAVAAGADEIDMVMNISAFKTEEHEQVQKDIECVVHAANGKPVKVIIETALLTDDEKQQACHLAIAAGAAFVKTSTGFNGKGAETPDVKLMWEKVHVAGLGVKASGGIRDRQTAEVMVAAGAGRLGTSAGVAIVTVNL